MSRQRDNCVANLPKSHTNPAGARRSILIESLIDANGITDSEAANQIGKDQSDTNNIIAGRLIAISPDALNDILKQMVVSRQA